MARLSAELVLGLIDRVSGPARKAGTALDNLQRKVRQTQNGTEGPRVKPRPSVLDAPMRSAEGGEAILAARTAALAGVGAAAYAGAEAYKDFAEAERALTRTGIKLGADRQTMAAIRREMGLIANKYAVPVQEVVESFDALAESGFELADARAALDGIVQATQGLGGSGRDTVNTFDAARKSIGLAQRDAERFFDIIAAGGAAGKFEGSDLARYLPSLLPVAARQGYEGLEGAARLVAFLEVMRDYVGSSEEAATATADIFEKISSPDVVKNFRKFGVDLEKELAGARKEGKDVLLVLSDILQKVTGGDATKLSELFGDRDSRRAANVLLTAIDRVRAAQEKLREESGGTIRYNVELVMEDAQAGLDKLTSAWDGLVKRVGAGIGTVATPAIEDLTAAIDRGQAYEAGLKRYEAEGGSKAEAREEFDRRYRRAHPEFDWRSGADQRARSQAFIDDTGAYGRGDAPTIYARLDRLLTLRQSRERAKASGGRDPLMSGPYKPSTLDDAPVRRGVPTPYDPAGSVMSPAEQRRAYNEGRRQAEETLAREDQAQPRYAVQRPPSEDYVERKRRRLAQLRGEAAPDIAPSVQPAEKGGRIRVRNSYTMPEPRAQPEPQRIQAAPVAPPVPIPSPRPDIAGPVQEEGERALQQAQDIGKRIGEAFNVTGTPQIDPSSVNAFIGRLNEANDKLSKLIASARAASDLPTPRAGTSGRFGSGRPWDRGGEFEDREP